MGKAFGTTLGYRHTALYLEEVILNTHQSFETMPDKQTLTSTDYSYPAIA